MNHFVPHSGGTLINCQIVALYHQVKRFAQDLTQKLPSYWSVYRLVRRLAAESPDLGPAKARTPTAKHSTWFIGREAAGLNAVWQTDHSPLDILLVCPDHDRRSPGPRSSLMTTATPWLDISFFRAAFNAADLTGVAPRNLANEDDPAGIFAVSRMCCTPITGVTSI